MPKKPLDWSYHYIAIVLRKRYNVAALNAKAFTFFHKIFRINLELNFVLYDFTMRARRSLLVG